jgi:hypothetical protein
MIPKTPADAPDGYPRSRRLPAGAVAVAPAAATVKPTRRTGALAKPRQGAPVLTGLRALAAAMSEEELRTRVTCGTKKEPGICLQLGLRWHYHYDSRRSPEGWPDLAIGKRGGLVVIFWELKTERGRVTPAQQEWLDILVAAGNQVGVRRPSDLLSGRIAKELVALAGLRAMP